MQLLVELLLHADRLFRFLIAAFALVILLVLVLVLTMQRHYHQMDKDLSHVAYFHNDKTSVIYESQKYVFAYREQLQQMVQAQAEGREPSPLVVMQLFDGLSALLRQQRALAETPAEQMVIINLQHDIDRLQVLLSDGVLTREGVGHLENMQQHFVEQLDELFRLYLNEAAGDSREAMEHSSQSARLGLLLGVAVVVISLITAVVVIGRIRRDWGRLRQEMAARSEAQESLQQALEQTEENVARRTEELERTASLLAEAQKVGRMGHWEWDIASGALKWSDEIFRIFGVDPAEYEPTYENFLQAVHPDDRQTVVTAVEVALRGERDYSVEHRVVRPDGRELVVHERGLISVDEHGTPVHMLGTVHDVTEHKQAEKQMQLAASVFHNTGDGVIITDNEVNILSVNEAFTSILGYRSDEVVGRNPRILQSGRHDPEFFQSLWHSLIETGQWQGEIWDRSKDGAARPLWMTINVVRDDHGVPNNYVALFRDISKAKEAERSLWQIAHHDPLTGLANRSLMYARLQMAMNQADRAQAAIAVLLIDLDGFKQVNDTLGHAMGDEVLVQVAGVLRAQVRESDTVVRYAGDEFVIILNEMVSREAINRIADQVLTSLSRPLPVRDGLVNIGASIGVSLYPTDAYDVDTMLRNADFAMYQAKRAGKGRCFFFERAGSGVSI